MAEQISLLEKSGGSFLTGCFFIVCRWCENQRLMDEKDESEEIKCSDNTKWVKLCQIVHDY